MSWTEEDAARHYGDCRMPYDYQAIIDSIGTPVVQVDDNDYQGDSRVLFTDGSGRFGILIFGWGSCSGCDALQACDAPSDVAELRNGLADGVHWEPTAGAMFNYIAQKDWELEWVWHADEFKKFLDLARGALIEAGAEQTSQEQEAEEL